MLWGNQEIIVSDLTRFLVGITKESIVEGDTSIDMGVRSSHRQECTNMSVDDHKHATVSSKNADNLEPSI